MKLLHLSDLHLGKRVNEFSMLEDQKYILTQIQNIIDEQQPQGVLVAGDVYDKSTPSGEAVELFDDFLTHLSQRKLKVFVISGNHDSAERLAFGGRIMKQSGIYLSPVYNGKVAPIPLTDDYGSLYVYMLPFVKPVHVRRFFPEREIASYTDAMKVVVEEMHIDQTKRNIFLAHQFVTGASRTESEEISVGGVDNVDVSAFDGFDYVALGHLHRSQSCGRECVRYSGTPLKYSFSEAHDRKSVTMVTMKEKGNIEISEIPLRPKRDMVEIKGTYDEVMCKRYYEGTTYDEDYMHITLTDEEDIPDAFAKLRVVYKNMMKLDYDNVRTRHSAEWNGTFAVERKSPLEHFGELFARQNGRPFNEEETTFLMERMEQIWGEDEE